MLKANDKKWIVLLTGTIRQDPTALAACIAPQVREKQYQRTLEALAKSRTGVERVVFCENSDAGLKSFEYLFDLYQEKQRVLEIYKVPMPDKQVFMGKGWGEGIIIKWVLENVRSFKEYSGFIKITGRYQVLNLKRIIEIIQRYLQTNPGLKFVCQHPINERKPSVYTDLFWSDREFYIKNLLDVYKEVDDNNGVYLEHIMARHLLRLCNSNEIGILPIPLIVRGTRGSSGRPYWSTLQIIKKHIKQTLLPLPPMRRLIRDLPAN